MSKAVGTAALVLAAALLLHAGYSTNHYFHLVRERFGDVDASLPLDVLLEAGAGLLVAAVAALTFSDAFKPLHLSTAVHAQAWEAMRSRPDFISFPPLSRSAAKAQAARLSRIEAETDGAGVGSEQDSDVSDEASAVADAVEDLD